MRRIELTERDLDLFRLLSKYRYLRSSFLEAFLGGNSTVLRWRLRDLFDAGYVRRPLQQWLFANARYVPVAYALGEKGRAALGDLDAALDATESRGGANFSHQALIDGVMASLELSLRQSPTSSLIHQAELQSRLNQADSPDRRLRLTIPESPSIIPDAMFGIRGPRGVVLYALEVDRESEPVHRAGSGSSYASKIARYDRLIEEGHYKRLLQTPAPLVVLHATLTSKRMHKLMELAHSKPFHAFTALSDVNAFGQLCAPVLRPALARWCRGRLPDLSLFSI
jgi:hypothetical protein